MTDWEWFLSSEAGRDRILRGEIGGLQANASSAHAQSARLSSQLTRLQGSLETRLNALSAAFDAYVELGDVREQLAGYPDTSAIRRDAVTAVEVLSRGGVPELLDHRGLDYWLSYAVNAVIALVGGTADTVAEQQAVELSPEAELFMVAAAGALGAGPRVGARVAPLLICDGSLTPRQILLWEALLADVYGPQLASVRGVWESTISQTAETWTAWVRARGRTVGAIGSLHWLDLQTADPADGTVPEQPPTPPSSAVDPRTGLRALVVGLVGQGTGDEAALLARSRALRARIENPTAPAAEEIQIPSRAVTDVVQAALLASGPQAPVRRELTRWVSPGLAAAAAHFGEAAQVLPEAEAQVSTGAGVIPVRPDGPDAVRLARAESAIAERTAVPLRRLLGPGLAAALLAVLALVTALTGHPRGALVLLFAAVLAGLALVYVAYDRRRAGQQRAAALGQLQLDVAEGQRAAEEVRRSQREAALDAARLAEQIITRLQASQSPGTLPTEAAPVLDGGGSTSR